MNGLLLLTALSMDGSNTAALLPNTVTAPMLAPHGGWGCGWAGCTVGWRGCTSACRCGCYGCGCAGRACYGGCVGRNYCHCGAVRVLFSDNTTVNTCKPVVEIGCGPPVCARLILEVPADARLFVEDVLVAGNATTRDLSTPPLERGAIYYYTVRVETRRDGREVVDSRRVLIRAGDVVRESFVNARS